MASVTPIPAPGEKTLEGGLIAGIAAYSLWGFLPLVFKLVDHVPSTTVVADRTIWSLILVGLVLLVTEIVLTI